MGVTRPRDRRADRLPRSLGARRVVGRGARHRKPANRPTVHVAGRSVAGPSGLIVGTVVVGVIGLVAFDQLFETFHEVFFPAGSVPVRSHDRQARPALPVPVLGRDRACRRRRDRRGGARRRLGCRSAGPRAARPARGRPGRGPGARLVTAPGRARPAQRRGGTRCPSWPRPSPSAAERILGGRCPRPGPRGHGHGSGLVAALAEFRDGWLRDPRPRTRAHATEATPVELRVIGDIAAGAAPHVVVSAGTAARIATGARLPDGADAVIPVETDHAHRRHRSAGSARPRRHRPRPRSPASSTRPSDRAAPSERPGATSTTAPRPVGPGSAFTAAAVALMAGAGVEDFLVHRRPRVPVLPTGDEVRARPAIPRGAPGIPDANGPGLRALVTAAGGEAIDLGIAGDDLDDVLRPSAAGARRRGGRADRRGRCLGRPVRRRQDGHGIDRADTTL